MQINKDDLIAGYSVLEIRKIMKKARDLKWNSDLVEELLDITPTKAKRLLKELQVQNYIEKVEIKGDIQYWKNTLKGNQLALASASQPIKRQTAGKLLEDFIRRIYELNSSTHYLYYVRRALLFGSYLTDKERLGDIDIIVEIEPKYSVRKEQMKAEREKINLVI